LTKYKNGETRDPCYNACTKLAKEILNKWYRLKHHIQTTYDPDGRFDDGWRTLQRQLDRERHHEPEEDEDEPSRKRQRKGASGGDESLGQFLDQGSKQQKMNFTRRPDHSDNMMDEGKRGYGAKEQSSKQKLMKTLMKFKKTKRPSASKGGMATVKIDF
jgi:hypothetical protein